MCATGSIYIENYRIRGVIKSDVNYVNLSRFQITDPETRQKLFEPFAYDLPTLTIHHVTSTFGITVHVYPVVTNSDQPTSHAQHDLSVSLCYVHGAPMRATNLFVVRRKKIEKKVSEQLPTLG